MLVIVTICLTLCCCQIIVWTNGRLLGEYTDRFFTHSAERNVFNKHFNAAASMISLQ